MNRKVPMKTIHGTLPSGTTAPSPEIKCWIPENNPNQIGIVILPGGGYGVLAEHEGAGYAEHFSEAGIACFVVTYRLGSKGFRHPAMLEDALAAIRTIRSHAADYGIAPNRIGIMGSSAGGHLASHTLVAWDRYESEISLRPDFGILCYPVILSQGPHAHTGSMKNLAGEAAEAALLESLSSEKHVTADTPPCFIWHTNEDPGVPVENSLLFAAALRRNGVGFELHIYEKGAHGLGLRASFPWEQDCLRWITEKIAHT